MPMLKRNIQPSRTRFIIQLIILTAAAIPRTRRMQTEFGSCDGCFCIPDGDESCPDRRPETDFTEILPNLRALTHSNPFSLKCDPYSNDSCEVTPTPLQAGGACVVDFTPSGDVCPEQWSYELRTYNGTMQQAHAEGLVVTHEGACGVCSTLQDMSVYMELGADLRQAATTCGIRGRLSASDGVACFKELGFTQACSDIWYYNTKNTNAHCLQSCAPFVLTGAAPIGAGPTCPMAQCLECDEVFSGPVFKKFAGRSRRNSGLLSDIVRSCSELVDLPQNDPCLEAVAAHTTSGTSVPAQFQPWDGGIHWYFPIKAVLLNSVMAVLF
jgi:hypothetical protein